MKRRLYLALALVVAGAGLGTGCLFVADGLFHVGDKLLGFTPLPGIEPERTDWFTVGLGAVIALSSARLLIAILRSRRARTQP